MAKLKVKFNVITIKDENTGKEYTIKTLRTAKSIAESIEEDEKNFIRDYLGEEIEKQH